MKVRVFSLEAEKGKTIKEELQNMTDKDINILVNEIIDKLHIVYKEDNK